MKPTTVVNVLDGHKYQIYVGINRKKLRLRQSKFAPPWYIICNRAKLEYKLQWYKEWLAEQPYLMEEARRKLKGKKIGTASRLELILIQRVLIPIVDTED